MMGIEYLAAALRDGLVQLGPFDRVCPSYLVSLEQGSESMVFWASVSAPGPVDLSRADGGIVPAGGKSGTDKPRRGVGGDRVEGVT
eukprot:2298378-Rhodomonas_salina.1